MSQEFTAVYEHGVLRPLTPVVLHEHYVVSLIITSSPQPQDGDQPFVTEIGDPTITWEQVQSALSHLQSPLSQDFERERDERYS